MDDEETQLIPVAEAASAAPENHVPEDVDVVGSSGQCGGPMDKLPIELAQGETLVSLDGIDDTESSGGNSQDGLKSFEQDATLTLEEVTTSTGEVIKLKKPRNEEKISVVTNQPATEGSGSVNSPSHHTDDGSFPCTLCSQRFSRKLYLNNHMEENHGVKYVFTERGRKVKLVRVPKNYDPQNMDDLDPSLRKLIKKSAGCQDLSKIVGVVTVLDPDTEDTVTSVTESNAEDRKAEGDKENEEGVECGFLVDRINTVPFQKAVSRGEVPFCAFAPISTQELYLLRIQDCSDSTRHMLVPASKEDVFNTPGALKTIEEQEPGNDDSLNYRVAIVAIARQMFIEQEKQLVVSVDAPLKKDRNSITCVKFLTLDKFADFAFLGFDGNVSEFEKSTNDSNTKEAGVSSSSAQDKLNSCIDKSSNILSSPQQLPAKEKTPPRAPARRGGRGGRRRVSRKSPTVVPYSQPQYQVQQQQQPPSIYNFPFQMLAPLPPPPEFFADYQTYVKMEQLDSQTQQSLTQAPIPQIPEPLPYTPDPISVPAAIQMPVPMPVKEITVSTTEPGAEISDEHINHDIITIALDQLIPMTSGDSFNVAHNGVRRHERSSRGGRRPGRKPGRKPMKERVLCDNDENSIPEQRNLTNNDGTAPKRRGRPPKNRVLMQISGPEDENSHMAMDSEDFDVFGKRMKLQLFQ